MIEPALTFRIEAAIVMNRGMDSEVAEIIRAVRLCQALQVLPRAGGLFDQDAYFVYCLERVLLADQKKAELDEARAKASVKG